MTKPVLYLIGGPNGSGKTTLARELVREENIAFLNADDIAANIGDGVGMEAGKILFNEVGLLMGHYQSFALESTISGHYHINLIKRAKSAGYQVIFVYIFLNSVMQNIARVRMRVLLGGHNVARHDIRRRYRRSLKNFWRTSEMSDYWELYYNGGETYQLVARGASQPEIVDVKLFNSFRRKGENANRILKFITENPTLRAAWGKIGARGR